MTPWQAFLEIISKGMTILSSAGGLEWLLNHVRTNIEFVEKHDAVIAGMKTAPPPKE